MARSRRRQAPDLWLYRRLRARYLGPAPDAARRTTARGTRKACRFAPSRKRLSARRRRRDPAWRTAVSRPGEDTFQAPIRTGVPALIELGRLLQITERILRDEETDEDLQLIFAPGSSLGGARPKASVVDQHGRLSIAKFPKETDDYSIETWEEIALRLAAQAGIATPKHELIEVAGKPVLLSQRFDRDDAIRIPFLSAMAMMGAKDGERGSYPEIVDALDPPWGAKQDRCARPLSARGVQRDDLECRRSPAQSRISVARQGWLDALAGLRPQSGPDRSEGADAHDEHRSRRRRLLSRSARGGRAVFRPLVGARPARSSRRSQR